MKLTVIKQTQETVEVSFPSFYKILEREMWGLFAEDDVRKVTVIPGMTLVLTQRISTCGHEADKFKDENRIDEKEFMDFYNASIKSLSLEPVLNISEEGQGMGEFTDNL